MSGLRHFLETASVGGGRNFRTVAGLPARDGRRVAAGKLFRCGFPGRLTEEVRVQLRDFGIRTVVTLQTRRELDILGEPIDGILPDARWEHIPIGDLWFQDSEPYPSGLLEIGHFYLSMVREHPEAWRRFFDVIAGHEHLPVLYHCTAGRDRTGVATVLLLDLLRVDRDAIREDYEASNAFFGEFVQEAAVLDPLLEAIDTDGGIDAFLGRLGVRRDVVERIRDGLLERR